MSRRRCSASAAVAASSQRKQAHLRLSLRRARVCRQVRHKLLGISGETLFAAHLDELELRQFCVYELTFQVCVEEGFRVFVFS